MSINSDRLAKQVKLAYEFMEALHGQTLALIKDVETQLAQADEELQCLRPRGYSFATNEMSSSLERPQPAIADYYAIYFRRFEARRSKGGRTTTPLDKSVPPISFLKVVLHEEGLEHPEVRFGVLTEVAKPTERADQHKKFEEIVNDVTRRALVGPAWLTQRTVKEDYQHNYISLAIRGTRVRLADLPDSEAIAERIVDPLLAMYREVAG